MAFGDVLFTARWHSCSQWNWCRSRTGRRRCAIFGPRKILYTSSCTRYPFVWHDPLHVRDKTRINSCLKRSITRKSVCHHFLPLGISLWQPNIGPLSAVQWGLWIVSTLCDGYSLGPWYIFQWNLRVLSAAVTSPHPCISTGIVRLPATFLK